MKELLVAIIIILLMFVMVILIQEKDKKEKAARPNAQKSPGYKKWDYLELGPKEWPVFDMTELKYKEYPPFQDDPESWLPKKPKPIPEPPSGQPIITHWDSCEY